MARARLGIGLTTYQADVVERWVAFQHQDEPSVPLDEKHPGKYLSSEIRIRCIERCKRNVSYREKVDDSIITIYVIIDDSPDFITVWGAGTGYWVRIYRVEDEKIRKVMDEGTRPVPFFDIGSDGNLLIRIQQAWDEPVTIWSWNGKEYQPSVNSP